MSLVPVVLSGGSGTRLWPLSRERMPKQLMPLVEPETTMIQQTLTRLASLPGAGAPLIVATAETRFRIAEQLRALGPAMAGAQIVLEPIGRNTAPAIAAAALLAQARTGRPDPVLLIAPADHRIASQAAFAESVARALPAAEAGQLVTFGVAPDRAETGYGYIRRGAALADHAGLFRVERFIEKPALEAASQMLVEGGYLWNAGLFLMRADQVLAELDRTQPTLVERVRAAVDGAATDLDFLRLEATAFAAAPAISIDYAVMETTDRAAVCPADFDWSDIGSWTALWTIAERDEAGVATRGEVIHRDVRNAYLRAEDGLVVAALGVEDLVLVATRDAVLATRLGADQDVRQVVTALRDAGRIEAVSHRRHDRPWGYHEELTRGPAFLVNCVMVRPGHAISLQLHHRRAEHWIVVSGTAEVVRDDERLTLTRDQSVFMPAGTTHSLINPGDAPLIVIEVQTGRYLGADDIERLE